MNNMKKLQNLISNGKYTDDNGNRHFSNAHLSYKNRSIIIDYEWCLHSYDLDSDIEKKAEGLVPFEVYPHGDCIYTGYVHTDSQYKKADIGELISILDDIIEHEDEYITPIIEYFDDGD